MTDGKAETCGDTISVQRKHKPLLRLTFVGDLKQSRGVKERKSQDLRGALVLRGR